MVSKYRTKDKEALMSLAEKQLKELIKEVKVMWKIHKEMWLSSYSPFGLEIIEQRYGGLILRLKSCKDRIEQFVLHNSPIEELDMSSSSIADRRNIHKVIMSYGRAATPSATYVAPSWWGDAVHY